MTAKDAGKVVRAGLLELMPERECAGCEQRVTLPGLTVMLHVGTVGAVVLFFCSERCDTPHARFLRLVTLKVRAVGEAAKELQPKARA